MNLNSPITEQIVKHWQTNAADAAPLKEAFIQALRTVGTVRGACEIVEIDSKTAYIWRAIDPEFREAWDYAKHDATDLVEGSLFRQATSDKSFLATIAWLKAHRPMYRDRLQVDVAEMQREIEQRLDNLAGLSPVSEPKGLLAEALQSSSLVVQPIADTSTVAHLAQPDDE